MPRMENPIFIVGLGRSGSSILAECVKRSGAVATFQESWLLDPFHKDFRTFLNKGSYAFECESEIRRMVDTIFSDKQIPGIHRDLWQQLNRFEDGALKERIVQRVMSSDKSIAEIFKAVIEETTIHRGFRQASVKFPVHITYISRLPSRSE